MSGPRHAFRVPPVTHELPWGASGRTVHPAHPSRFALARRAHAHAHSHATRDPLDGPSAGPWSSSRLSLLCSCLSPAPHPIQATALALSSPIWPWALCPRAKSPPGRASTAPHHRRPPRATCSRPRWTRPARCWSFLVAWTTTARHLRISGSGILRPPNGPTAPPPAASQVRAEARAWSTIPPARSSSSSVGVRTLAMTSRTPGNGIRQATLSRTVPARARAPAVSTAWRLRNQRARRCSLGAALPIRVPPSGPRGSITLTRLRRTQDADLALGLRLMGAASRLRLATPGNGIPPRVRGPSSLPPPRPAPATTLRWYGTASAAGPSCSAE